MPDLPPFLQSIRARKSRLERLLDRCGQLEHDMRDTIAQVLELVPPDDDLASECRRFLEDLDR